MKNENANNTTNTRALYWCETVKGGGADGHKQAMRERGWL